MVRIVRLAIVLFKLRVVALLLCAAIGGAFLAAGGWPGWNRLVVLMAAGGSTAAGASALNQYLEREADAAMARTRDRPLVTGAIHPGGLVLLMGGLLTVAPGLACFPSNPALGLFVWLGALVYLVVYTLWLKPRTPLNIVIGGAAGSAAVLSGGAAAGQWHEPGVLTLAALVFLWTPTHFWSLAIMYRDDYRHGRVPMLPARLTPRAAAAWVALHSCASALAALLLGVDPGLGPIYLLPVALATLALLWYSIRLIARPERSQASALFRMSNAYLGIVVGAVCLGVLV